MSKGSNRRPTLIDQEQFNQNWDTIFNKAKTHEEEAQALQEVARQQHQHVEHEAAQ